MSEVAKYDITIKQGETWTMNFVVNDDYDVPKDLTGYSAKVQIRNKPGGDVYATMQTPSSGITINGGAGSVTLNLSATVTGTLNFQRGVYDIFLTSGAGVVSVPFEGDVIVNPRVSI